MIRQAAILAQGMGVPTRRLRKGLRGFRHLLLSRFIVVGSLLMAQTVRAQDLRGIFVVPWRGDMQTKQMAGLLNISFVDGFYLNVRWQDIEPQQRQFNWSYLDRQLATIAQAHKLAEISVSAGAWSPDWIYQAGATRLKTIVPGKFSWAFGRPISVPVPWDPIYLSAWSEFISAFGRHCGANLIVKAVKITGISLISEEIELPTLNGGKMISNGKKQILVPDLISEWRDLGYSPVKVEQAFRLILRSFADAFPQQELIVMTDHDGFPSIGSAGEDAPDASHIGTARLLPIGRDMLGRRFAGQYNGLKAGGGALPTVIDLAAFGKSNPIGFQTAWPISHNTTDSDGAMTPVCVMNNGKRPCYAKDVMTGVVDIAHSHGAHFLEIFPSDAEDPQFTKILREARDMLVSGNDGVKRKASVR